MLEATVDFGPKRADDVFAGRWIFSKVFSFEVQMPILPEFQRLLDCAFESDEVKEHSGSLIVLSTNCRLRHIAMTMPAGAIAFAEKFDILLI